MIKLLVGKEGLELFNKAVRSLFEKHQADNKKISSDISLPTPVETVKGSYKVEYHPDKTIYHLCPPQETGLWGFPRNLEGFGNQFEIDLWNEEEVLTSAVIMGIGIELDHIPFRIIKLTKDEVWISSEKGRQFINVTQCSLEDNKLTMYA